MITVTIPEYRLGDFEKAYTKLAKKFGDSISVEVSEPFPATFTYYSKYDYQDVKINAVDVTITPKFYVIDGWEFVGTIEEEVLYTRPGKSIPEYLRKLGNYCFHCQKNRHRNKLIVFKNLEDGHCEQFGTTCAKDYFGHDIGELLEKFAVFMAEVQEFSAEEDFEKIPRQSLTFSLKFVVESLLRVNAKFEYVSGKQAYSDPTKISTKFLVQDVLVGFKKTIEVLEGVKPEYSTEEYIKTILEKFEHETSDFGRNVYHLFQQEYVPWKSIGYICGTWNTFQKSLEEPVQDLRQGAIDSFGKYYPEFKERITAPLTVTRTDKYDPDMYNENGSTRVIGWLLTIQGVIDVVFKVSHDRKNAQEMVDALTVGNTVNITGTISGYVSEFGNFKLNRVKVN